mgnify:FL=1|jgi:hypothetical protein
MCLKYRLTSSVLVLTLFLPMRTLCLASVSHYSKDMKAAKRPDHVNMEKEVMSMDGKSFSKLCLDSPKLGKHVGRTDVDLVFSKAKPLGDRRLTYENFLDALLLLAMRIFPDDEPIKALTFLLANFIFGVFDQTPSVNEEAVLEGIFDELNLDE